jgi:hypothetical protein
LKIVLEVLNIGVANQRASDQVFVGIWISEALAEKIESARDGVPRSQFMRDAIAEFLRQKGFPVGEEKNPPSRVKLFNSAKVRAASKLGADKIRRRHTPAAG